MKLPLSLSFLLFAAFSMNAVAQTVPSTCDVEDSLASKYRNDAELLTLRKFYQYNYSYKDSIEIPRSYSDTLLRALMAVYYAKNLPERDVVIGRFNIHAWPDLSMNSMSLDADSTLPWMIKLRAKELPTGEPSIDTLITRHGMSVYYYYAFRLSDHRVILSTEKNYNMDALAKLFREIGGVSEVMTGGAAGDGSDIHYTELPDAIRLTYKYGWGDCPAGCMFERYWVFNVYPDCSVEFVTSYGDRLDNGLADVIKGSDLAIFPNPFFNHLYIKKLQRIDSYQLFNVQGQVVDAGTPGGNSIWINEELPAGMYYLVLRSDNKIYSQKVVKQ